MKNCSRSKRKTTMIFITDLRNYHLYQMTHQYGSRVETHLFQARWSPSRRNHAPMYQRWNIETQLLSFRSRSDTFCPCSQWLSYAWEDSDYYDLIHDRKNHSSPSSVPWELVSWLNLLGRSGISSFLSLHCTQYDHLWVLVISLPRGI